MHTHHAEAVQRPTMNFVAIKTPEQSDLLSLHRVRSRLVRQRTAIINQIRGFLIERGVTVRQGPAPLRKVLPEVLSSPPQALSPRILRLIAERSMGTGAVSTSASKSSQPRQKSSDPVATIGLDTTTAFTTSASRPKTAVAAASSRRMS